MNVRDYLKLLRKRNGYTQERIAEVLGISKSMYCRIEKNFRNLKVDTIKKLSDFYDIPAQMFFLSKENYDDYRGLNLVELATIYFHTQKEVEVINKKRKLNIDEKEKLDLDKQFKDLKDELYKIAIEISSTIIH